MSHFTHIKTRFQNLFYLEKALNKLDISYVRVPEKQNHLQKFKKSLLIPQSNGYDLKFIWNGKEYELIVDMSFWDQSYTMESFIDKISQKYASEVVISESQKTGFHPVKSSQNLDGSYTFVLERWNI